ncbi:MAG: ATP-binding protein [Spirochaetaceae bacterium]|jgi:anti-sigma regulatory factor (Ser/Thr protein kinase)|nr:ATP-binding protein [Spirochaetaceae bacterium]
MIQFEKEIVLSAQTGELDKLTAWLDVILDEAGCPAPPRAQIAVAAEEVFVNICRYAYGGASGSARVLAGIQDFRLVLRFEDSGAAFNPLDHAPPDVSAPISGREAGGLGIFIVRKWMDSVQYRRTDGKNELTLYKTLAHTA